MFRETSEEYSEDFSVETSENCYLHLFTTPLLLRMREILFLLVRLLESERGVYLGTGRVDLCLVLEFDH